MVFKKNIVYSGGYIHSGGFKVSSDYEMEILQIRLSGETAWSDIGRILSNGECGFKRKFRIGYPREVELRIFNGPVLGSVYIGEADYSSRRSSYSDNREYNKRESVRGKRFGQFIGWIIYGGLLIGGMTFIGSEYPELMKENLETFQIIVIGGLGIIALMGFVRFIGFLINR